MRLSIEKVGDVVVIVATPDAGKATRIDLGPTQGQMLVDLLADQTAAIMLRSALQTAMSSGKFKFEYQVEEFR